MPRPAAGSLNSMQLQTVDRVFEKLFGYAWGTQFELPRSSDNLDETEQFLVELLGRRSAARLLSRKPTIQLQAILAKKITNNSKPTVHKKAQTYKFKPRDDAPTSKPPSSTTSSTTATLSTAAKPPPAAVSDTNNQPVPSGVDQVLAQMNGPTKLTTIAKTNLDWETFKDNTGMGEKLEAAADSDTAYLKKQDFLGRVDQRTFQLEKAERDRERAKRG